MCWGVFSCGSAALCGTCVRSVLLRLCVAVHVPPELLVLHYGCAVLCLCGLFVCGSASVHAYACCVSVMCACVTACGCDVCVTGCVGMRACV